MRYVCFNEWFCIKHCRGQLRKRKSTPHTHSLISQGNVDVVDNIIRKVKKKKD